MTVKHFVSASCAGEPCRFSLPKYPHHPFRYRALTREENAEVVQCGRPATHKIGEEIMHDDPQPVRHNLTAYLCCIHFSRAIGTPCEPVGPSPPPLPKCPDCGRGFVAGEHFCC